MKYGDFKTPLKIKAPTQTKDTPEYQECVRRVVAAERRWHVSHKREIHCDLGHHDEDGKWIVEVGYMTGPEWHFYRRIVCKSWADAERVIQNHTKRFPGMVTVCGFELPKVDDENLRGD